MASSRLSATKIGVGALIALTLSTAVATVVNLQSGNADSVPTASATSPAAVDGAAAQYAFELLASRHEAMGLQAREKTLADLLPNHKFTVGDADPVALATGIVVGTVTKVAPGAAFLSDPETGDDVEVDFTDAAATSRDIIITVSVESALGDISGDASVSFGLTIDGTADADRAITGFENLGRVIAVLDAAGDLRFEPALHSVRQSGGLLGTVSEDGVVSFPSLGEEGPAFLDGLDTVADLLTEATAPDVISKVDRAGSSSGTD